MRISEIVGASDAELDALVASLETEIAQAWIDARPSGSSKPSHVPSVYPSGKRIAELAPPCRIRLVARLLDREVRRPSWHYDGTSENERSVLRWLLRAPLPWSARDVIDFMRLWLKRSEGHSHEAIGRALLRIATPFAESREVWEATADFRQDYCVRYLNLLALDEERNEDEVRREVDAAFESGHWPFAVDDIGLSSSDRELILSFDAFFSGVTEAEIRADDPLLHRMAQVDAGVTEHLIKATGVKPSAKWRKGLVLGTSGKLLETVLPTIRETVEPIAGVPADALRGLAWALEADGDAKGLGRLAEASMRQIEGVGIVAQKAYFSAVQSLGRLEGDDAVLALIELGRIAKRPKVRAAVEDAIAIIAERRRVTIPELLEGATPSFGLDASGDRNDMVTGGTVRIEIVGSGVRTTFTTDTGQVRKSLSKDESTPAIKERAKEMGRILQATKDSYDIRMASRSAAFFGDWRNRVLLHPLLGTLARRLVWSVGGVAALWDGVSLADVAGRPIQAEEKAEVLLWHPVESDSEEIRQWQKRISDLGMTQPFRQIYREVYVPVREDGNTVGRFRAHVIRQGRAATVMQGRGWRWPAIGTFDSGGLPSFWACHLDWVG
ncbi:DUF4132 domain-containing protein [bacterium]|nr:MAG: DUF4132 domain-containing protein [bacterium]